MADRPALSEPQEILPPESNDHLARVLFDKMERLDPTEDSERGWDGLTEYEKHFYRVCVGAVLKTYNSPTTA